jgi:hypothetical protein
VFAIVLISQDTFAAQLYPVQFAVQPGGVSANFALPCSIIGRCHTHVVRRSNLIVTFHCSLQSAMNENNSVLLDADLSATTFTSLCSFDIFVHVGFARFQRLLLDTDIDPCLIRIFSKHCQRAGFGKNGLFSAIKKHRAQPRGPRREGREPEMRRMRKDCKLL